MREKTVQHLYDQLTEYVEGDFYPYHMPGHKRRACGALPEELFGLDITEIDGFDDLHHPEGILATLRREAASLYGAEESFYLVNGSTCGVQAAISAALPVGGHILMARNCHRCAYHTVYLRQLQVTYLYPPVMEDWGIHDAVTPAQVREALEQEPDIGAVLIVSPTYEGRLADVAAIAEIAHGKGLPLIVDEAHGAHLGLAAGFAPNSCQSGADLVIQSVHKTLPAMTQTALLHVRGERIDRDRLRRFLRIYQTSSPSYVLMASIDNALQMVRGGLLESFRRRYLQMMEELGKCRHFRFLPPDETKQDLGKLVISTRGCGMTGRELADRLREQYHLQLELAAEDYALAMFTVGDTEEGYVRMTEALLAIEAEIAAKGAAEAPIEAGTKTAVPVGDVAQKGEALLTAERIPLARAWDMPWEVLPIEQAFGRRAGEFIQLYPPGVPIVAPGEIFTKKICDTIVAYIKEHLNVQGVELVQGRLLVRVLR